MFATLIISCCQECVIWNLTFRLFLKKGDSPRVSIRYYAQGVRSGIKQLERYKRLFELKTGATWDTFIDFY